MIGIPIGLLIATPFAALVLVARRRDTLAIVWSFVWSVLGMFVGLMLCPAVHPPHEPGDEIRYMIGGAILGWIAGVLVGHRDKLRQVSASHITDGVDALDDKPPR